MGQIQNIMGVWFILLIHLRIRLCSCEINDKAPFLARVEPGDEATKSACHHKDFLHLVTHIVCFASLLLDIRETGPGHLDPLRTPQSVFIEICT